VISFVIYEGKIWNWRLRTCSLRDLKPETELFTKLRPTWLRALEGTKQSEGYP